MIIPWKTKYYYISFRCQWSHSVKQSHDLCFITHRIYKVLLFILSSSGEIVLTLWCGLCLDGKWCFGRSDFLWFAEAKPFVQTLGLPLKISPAPQTGWTLWRGVPLAWCPDGEIAADALAPMMLSSLFKTFLSFSVLTCYLLQTQLFDKHIMSFYTCCHRMERCEW